MTQPVDQTPEERARAAWKAITDEMLLAKRSGMTPRELAVFTDRRAVEILLTALADERRRVFMEAAEAANNMGQYEARNWCLFKAQEVG